MQQYELTDVNIIEIEGFRVEFVSINESGFTEESVEVPTPGVGRQIGSGYRQLPNLEMVILINRNSPTLRYYKEWKDAGSDARRLVAFHTDKTGNILNTEYQEEFMVELTSMVPSGYDESARTFMKMTVTLPVREYEMIPRGQ